jgi:hypothetical protein
MKRLFLIVTVSVMLGWSPAWATPLTLLDGTWDLYIGWWSSVSLVTSEFTAYGNNDGDSSGMYQGVSYCQSSGFDCQTGSIPQQISVGYQLDAPLPPCITFGGCGEMDVPATLAGQVWFIVDGTTFVPFDYFGEGIAHSPDGLTITHADFGQSAFQQASARTVVATVPDVSTALLLLTGLAGLWPFRRRGT